MKGRQKMKVKKKLSRNILFVGLSVVVMAVVGLSAFFFADSDNWNEAAKISSVEISNFEKKQAKRAEGLRFRALSLRDENGVIDPNGLRNAKKHIEEMEKVQPQRLLKQKDAILEAAVEASSWTWFGPGNVGGRIRSIAIQPGNPNNMYVGSVGGGIWRTTNAGSSWFPVNDFMANLAVTSIVINPVDNNIMFAGTGEGFNNIDAIQGMGIFRSGNQGAAWTQLAATNNPNFNFVNRLAVSPDGATVLAATGSGTWRSTDSGTNWTQTTAASSMDVKFDPGNSLNAVGSGLAVARFSTDGGATWTAATFNPVPTIGPTGLTNGRVELAYAPSNTSIVYASVNNNNGRLYRSTDGGQTYNMVNNGMQYLAGQGWYDNVVWVNPQDDNFVIVGGVHLWRSPNGGTNLTQISDGSANSAHADHHIIVSHPNFNNSTNKIVYFGNDGGIHRADDVSTVTQTAGWFELNNNLGITQFYGAVGNQNAVVIGGTQDNGTIRDSGGTESWTPMAVGDGGFVAADQTNTNYFYGEFQNLQVIRSSDGGLTATQITNGLGDFTSGQTNFIAPLVIDPLVPNRLLAGGWSLWRTNDARTGANWVSIKPATAAPTGPPDLRPISAIAIAPDSSSIIVVGHNDGQVFRTSNGVSATPTWTRIDNPAAGLPARQVTRLAIDNTRSPTWIYATFGGFSADNLYVSRDFGASWIDITGSGATGLPNVPVRAIAIHPYNRDLLYVGTEVGIFTSPDAGATWDLPQGGPANVSVDELTWLGANLLAATHGRGIYLASGGIYVDCNYGGFELGSFTQPFRTINAAINAIPANKHHPIWLKPCTYNESLNTTFNANKRFELRNLGGTATVVGQ